MKIHKLKTWSEYFSAVVDGSKTFEIRFSDRDYQVGDQLLLQEYVPATGGYTGREYLVEVTYVYDAVEGDSFGVVPGWYVMGIKPV